MTTTKILLLAGLAAISLGAGNAMAEGSGIAVSDYWAQQYRIAAKQAADNAAHTAVPSTVQSGASDESRPHPKYRFDLPLTAGGGG